MSLNLNKFAVEVHENSSTHGWWETERSIGEVLALIHSEWSEALEEYRAGRGMVWFHCCEVDKDGHGLPCDPKDEGDCLNYAKRETCEYLGKKPEGIAVELIDGCIRILDLMGAIDVSMNGESTIIDMIAKTPEEIKAYCERPFPEFITVLHALTSEAFQQENVEQVITVLLTAESLVYMWILKQGLDPETIMLQKHEYNKTRPYKHGNKVC